MNVLRNPKYGAFRYQMIDGKAWIYASDLKHRMKIDRLFESIKKINQANVRREEIETPLGNINAYLVNKNGVRELMNFSLETQIKAGNCREWLIYKMEKLEEE